jgi:AcrR family transcriptional regulator
MPKPTRTPVRREDSLTRERIIGAATALLDASGEAGLTFRALAERLATGAGAIYWHVKDKQDLLSAASDAVVAAALENGASGKTPESRIRAMALGLFDTMDEHPWVGAVLARAPGDMPTVRIFERIGQQVTALGVPSKARWGSANALLSYILGVGGQNAANRHYAVAHELDREAFLGGMAEAWEQLDADTFPFARSVAGQLATHDDRADFLAGIDLILKGMRG